ncbi:MAG: sortase [Saccharofermentanales bacterium]|jgi:sortase A|nr:sortase [Bacillota bacterium]
MKKKKFIHISLNILATALLLAGIYLLIRPYYQNYRQRNKIRDILTEMEITHTDGSKPTSKIEPVKEIEVSFAPDSYKVDGEEWEEFAKPTPTASEANNREFVKVKTYARLDIPSIDFSMPIADKATLHSLRVAIGHYGPSAPMGEKGNFVLFGHRGYRSGNYLHHIHEVKPGDEIIVISSKNAYIYTMDSSIEIKPSLLTEKINERTEQARIIIVSCAPLRDTATHKQGSLRILLYGHLKETIPLTDN